MAEHHCGSRFAAESSCQTRMTFSQSSVRTLPRVISLRTRSTRISPPPPGRLPSPAAFSRSQHRFQRQVCDLREVMNFGRAETVHIDLRKALFDGPQHVFVPFQRQLRDADRPAAESGRHPVPRFPRSSSAERFHRQYINLGMVGRPIERTEVADRSTRVGVVDVAVDVVGAERFRMQSFGDGIGGSSDGRSGRATAAAPRLLPESDVRLRQPCQAVTKSEKTRFAFWSTRLCREASS